MNKKIIYIANINLSTERAHGIQITKTCEAMVNKGARIELWVSDSGDDTERNFAVKILPSLDFLPNGWKLNFYLKSFSFFISAFFFLLREKSDAVVYTRDEIILFLVFLTKRKIFWESHMTLWLNFLAKGRIKRLSGIVAISENLKKIIIEKYGASSDRVVVAHDAVDLSEFGGAMDKTEARRKLDLEQNKKTIVYTGSIFERKGIFTLLETAASLIGEYVFLIVGGGIGDETEKVKKFIKERKLGNVISAGHVFHKKIPVYLSAADVLVLPNSALDERTRDFTSPLKLFEYMASDRPIIASATPTIKEILNNNNAVLVEPDSEENLKAGILKIFDNPEWARGLAQQARKDVENYTWKKRVEKILNFILLRRRTS